MVKRGVAAAVAAAEDKDLKVEARPELQEGLKVWNRVIRGLIEARDAWEEHVGTHRTVKVAGLPTFAQRIFSMTTNRAVFEIALPRLLSLAKNRGDLEKLLIGEGD